ncbi:unnamed protein product, partial [Symbiodinium necroappetens]
MTTFQNDIQAAVEVDCGSGWVVLYPKQRLQIAGSAESLWMRLREDYTITSHVYIHAEAGLFSSEMCTSELGPFNIQAERWLEREKMSVAFAEAQALLRKVRDKSLTTHDLEKSQKVCQRRLLIFLLLYMVLTLALSGLTMHFAPELTLKGWVAFCSVTAVFTWTMRHINKPLVHLEKRYGTGASLVLMWSSFLFFLLGPYVLLIGRFCQDIQHDFWECMMAVADITDFIPLCILPVGLTIHWFVRKFHGKLAVQLYPDLLERHVAQRALENCIVFHGRVLEGMGRGCVCSWPGKYAPAWDAMVRSSKKGNTSAAVVFLPEGSQLFGLHDSIPDDDDLKDLTGACWCVPLYGERKPWGCKWWTKWIANVEEAVRQGAKLEVYFFANSKGKGKAQSFGTCGSEHLRREALWRRR